MVGIVDEAWSLYIPVFCLLERWSRCSLEYGGGGGSAGEDPHDDGEESEDASITSSRFALAWNVRLKKLVIFRTSKSSLADGSRIPIVAVSCRE